jgi:shikimate dehydrogenase
VKINGETKLLGIIGWPVKHSLSPFLHNRTIEEFRLNCVFVPLSVPRKFFKEAMMGVRALGFTGLSITIPYKNAAVKHLDEMSKEASIIGAVNTVLLRKDKLFGYNTDAYGFSESLRIDGHMDVAGKTVTVIGAGGVSRAISTVCVLNGASSINLTDIVKNRCAGLCKRLSKIESATKIQQVYAEDSTLEGAVKKSDILINATPLGMNIDDPLPIPTELIHPNSLVFDAIYNVENTSILRKTKKMGCKTLNGLGMLAYQAAFAFEIWTGMRPNVDTMKKALRDCFSNVHSKK